MREYSTVLGREGDVERADAGGPAELSPYQSSPAELHMCDGLVFVRFCSYFVIAQYASLFGPVYISEVCISLRLSNGLALSKHFRLIFNDYI